MQDQGPESNGPNSSNHHIPPMDGNTVVCPVPSNGYPDMQNQCPNYSLPPLTSPNHTVNSMASDSKPKKDRKRKSSEKPGVGPIKIKNDPEMYSDLMIKQEPGVQVPIKQEPLWEGCPTFDGYDFQTPKPTKVKQKKLKQEKITDSLTKKKPKRDRFNGMSEEEVLQRVLPDHLVPNLDIVIVGINPGLTAAFVGHHYAGPGNHFWKCLFLSGFIPEPMNAYDDRKLLQYGIGFTNIVERTSRGSADLTKKEIKEGGEILLKKLQEYKPKIAAFNGKGIYEVFCGHKNFHIGKQPDPLPGTETMVFVMPSSSARFTQLPRAIDKVPFYVALRKLRDYVKGDVKELDESEVSFPDLELKVKPRVDRVKTEEDCDRDQKHKGQFMQIRPDAVKQENNMAASCQGGQMLWQPQHMGGPPQPYNPLGSPHGNQGGSPHSGHLGSPPVGHLGSPPSMQLHQNNLPGSSPGDQGLFSSKHQLVPVKQENLHELAHYGMMPHATGMGERSPSEKHGMARVKSENQSDYAAYGMQPSGTGCSSQALVPCSSSYTQAGVGQYPPPPPYMAPYSSMPSMMYPNTSPISASSFSMSMYNHMSSTGNSGYGYSSMSFTGMLSDPAGVSVSAVAAQGSAAVNSVHSHSWMGNPVNPYPSFPPSEQGQSEAGFQQHGQYYPSPNDSSPRAGFNNDSQSYKSPEKGSST